MIKRIALLVLCVAIVSVGAMVIQPPSTPALLLRVSTYPLTKWIPVAAPTGAMTNGGVGAVSTALGNPRPAATKSYQYAFVDEQNKLSPWSLPTTMVMAKAQGVMIDYSTMVIPTDAIAIMWRSETGPMLTLIDRNTSYQAGHPYCFDPFRPGINSFQEDWNGYVNQNLPPSAILTAQPSAPPLRTYTVPNVDLEIAYCEVSHTGETALSPSFVSPKIASLAPTDCTFRIVLFKELPPPYGSLGRHVYARPVGTTTWYRVPAPHSPDTPATPEDWLWRLGEQWGTFYSTPNIITHNPAAEPKSEICNLLQARMDVTQQGQVIVVDVAEVKTKTPIYDRYGPGNNEQNMVVTTDYGAKWKLTQDTNPPAGCVNQGTNWPLLLVSNQKSKWHNMAQTAPAAWAGLTYLDWSGGQCFGNEFHGCSFSGRQRGVSITYSSGSNGHTPSEQLFKGCFFAGQIAVEVTGNQSANVRFDGPTYVISDQSRKRGTAAFFIDTPNQLRFTGDTYFDYGFSGVLMGAYTNINFEYVWCDQGYPVFFDGVSRQSCNVTIRGGKLNSWNLWGGQRPWLIRNPAAILPTSLTLENVQMQHNFPLAKPFKVYSPIYQAFRARFTNSDGIYNATQLFEPTWEQQVDLGFRLSQFGSYISGVWTWAQPAMPKVSKNINVE